MCVHAFYAFYGLWNGTVSYTHLDVYKRQVEEQRNYIKRQMKLEGDYLFIVEDLKRNSIGMKGVYNYNPVAKTVETGRFLSYGSQVQNIEALKLSFDFAFDVLGVEKIVMLSLIHI